MGCRILAMKSFCGISWNPDESGKFKAFHRLTEAVSSGALCGVSVEEITKETGVSFKEFADYIKGPSLIAGLKRSMEILDYRQASHEMFL